MCFKILPTTCLCKRLICSLPWRGHNSHCVRQCATQWTLCFARADSIQPFLNPVEQACGTSLWNKPAAAQEWKTSSRDGKCNWSWWTTLHAELPVKHSNNGGATSCCELVKVGWHLLRGRSVQHGAGEFTGAFRWPPQDSKLLIDFVLPEKINNFEWWNCPPRLLCLLYECLLS